MAVGRLVAIALRLAVANAASASLPADSTARRAAVRWLVAIPNAPTIEMITRAMSSSARVVPDRDFRIHTSRVQQFGGRRHYSECGLGFLINRLHTVPGVRRMPISSVYRYTIRLSVLGLI